MNNDEHVETIILWSRKSPDNHINVKIELGEGEGKVPLDAIAEWQRNKISAEKEGRSDNGCVKYFEVF